MINPYEQLPSEIDKNNEEYKRSLRFFMWKLSDCQNIFDNLTVRAGNQENPVMILPQYIRRYPLDARRRYDHYDGAHLYSVITLGGLKAIFFEYGVSDLDHYDGRISAIEAELQRLCRTANDGKITLKDKNGLEDQGYFQKPDEEFLEIGRMHITKQRSTLLRPDVPYLIDDTDKSIFKEALQATIENSCVEGEVPLEIIAPLEQFTSGIEEQLKTI